MIQNNKVHRKLNRIMPQVVKSIGCLIVFGYLLLRFYFVGFSKALQISAVCLGVFAYLFFNRKIILKKKDNLIWFIVLCTGYIGILILSIIIPLLHRTGDFSYARTLVSYGLDLLCWLVFYVHIIKVSEKNSVSADEEFAKEFSQIMVMYVLFSLICIIVPSFRSFWQTTVYFSDYSKRQLLNPAYIGRIGWNGFAGFGATFMCTLCLFFNLIQTDILNLDGLNKRVKPSLFIYSAFLLLGNFLYGRIGLVISVFLIAVYIIIALVVKKNKKLIIWVFGGAAGVSVILFILKTVSAKMDKLISWAFEPVINLFSGKGLSTGSTDVLLRMLKTDVPFTSFLIGDGYYTNPTTGSYYRSVDVGFLRLIFLGGILFTVLAYVLTFLSARQSIPKKAICWIMLGLIFAAFEIKGEIWLSLLIVFMPRIFIMDDYVLSPLVKKTSDRLFIKFGFFKRMFGK